MSGPEQLLLRRRRRNGTILSPQKGNQLLNLLIRKRLPERRHFGPAIKNLSSNLPVGHSLLLANLSQRRRLFSTFKIRAMAEAAAFIAVKNSTSHLSRFCVRAVDQSCRTKQ